jgi:hypothetical protein
VTTSGFKCTYDCVPSIDFMRLRLDFKRATDYWYVIGERERVSHLMGYIQDQDALRNRALEQNFSLGHPLSAPASLIMLADLPATHSLSASRCEGGLSAGLQGLLRRLPVS